jgi:hypothetical protein
MKPERTDLEPAGSHEGHWCGECAASGSDLWSNPDARTAVTESWRAGLSGDGVAGGQMDLGAEANDSV